ncbi:MAG TPA: tRNA (N(6)-L-threonylcarbamoyladenosine(37)-C(2))-methylthiotransferase MtaB [Cryomorphaceae bacterium]|jgi:threonylcarbamoyladenosine tRNA methylthiotransferase MtaB|nr:tRNA (N(6)-L-threonylcarbamoyladenosine(37)-C(2))-methylthiotransferase MtaB [Cryomorphaceae bacterium]
MGLSGKSVAFHTLGCKLNFAESSTISRDLQAAGMHLVDLNKGADVVVINTCSVTNQADVECRAVVRKALRANDQAFVVVTGCYAQLRPSEIAAMEGVDLVVGAQEKLHLRKFLTDLSKQSEAQIHSCDIQAVEQYQAAYSFGDRTRAFLKVQDGCDYKCTYCTIPMARGVSRSAPLDQAVAQARALVKKGVQEVVLTGVNIGDYGKGELGNKRHDHRFIDLLLALDEVDGLDRIRISSIEPNLLNQEVIDFVSGSQRFVPHFHIPLQSGNNEILGLMKRRYQRELYQERVEAILARHPDACIGVDVIVGFPGETEDHFLDTYQFLQNLPIGYLHVFTYSERPGTEAIDLPGVVPPVERKARNHRLRLLSAQKQKAFALAHEGSVRRVLWEDADRQGYMQGYTENYIRVSAPFDTQRAGTVEHIVLGPWNAQDTMSVQSIVQPSVAS